MFALSMTREARFMSDRPASGSIQVLLVEDNPIDVMMAKEAFKEGAIDAILIVVEDGMQAMEYLRQQGKYGSACLPDFILLDLNLPKKNGREVLAEIKADPKLQHIPVVVFSGSSDEWDVRDCYNLHANCYVVKPSHLDDYVSALKSLDRFWFDLVRLPVPTGVCTHYSDSSATGDGDDGNGIREC
jgi:two-component system, chemotaxis family, response regulator Rcp1